MDTSPMKNQEILINEFNIWKNIKNKHDNLHEFNLEYHNIIKKNIDKIVDYFDKLSEGNKEKLKINKSIQYLFWEAYKNNLISFEQFKKLNSLETSGRDKKYLENQKIKLLEIIKENDLLNKLISDYNLIDSRIDYYFEANKRFYQELLENAEINQIIDFIEETFRNTNSNNYGNSKKIINKGTHLYDIFIFFLNVKNNDYKSIYSSFDKINQLGQSMSFEVLGMYHLNKKIGFIFNSRVEKFFNFMFKIPLKTQYGSFRDHYYMYREIYTNFFNNSKSQNILSLNIECDSFIYWFTNERIKIYLVKEIDDEIKEIKQKKIPKADKTLLINATIRKGQKYFKDELKKDYSKCPITSISQNELLIASHIKPWAECNLDSEKLDKDNGFLLSSNIDKLFDRGLISFSDESKMIISKRLK